MSEHATELSILARKYQEQVKALEDQLAEAKRRQAVVLAAMELLKEEGSLGQERLFLPAITDQYKDVSMTVAIKKILESEPSQSVTAEIILSELTKHGFQSSSKNLKRDVYTRLFRMEKKRRLVSKKVKGIKNYFLPKEEDNAQR